MFCGTHHGFLGLNHSTVQTAAIPNLEASVSFPGAEFDDNEEKGGAHDFIEENEDPAHTEMQMQPQYNLRVERELSHTSVSNLLLDSPLKSIHPTLTSLISISLCK